MPSFEARAPHAGPPEPTAPAPVDEPRELRVALGLTFVVLAVLTAVKPLGGIPVLGAAAFTVAAVLQLYLPLWRIDRLGLDHAFLGLHTRALGRDMKLLLVLVAVTFPPYAAAHYLFMTQMHGWAQQLGLPAVASLLPRLQLDLHLPEGPSGWLAAGWWLAQLVATHGLGVALPEETFYRGYLQPRLEARWPPRVRVFGVLLGRGAIATAALFALGHFLGEWNPLRLGPLLPALLFAWQRNATGSVVGAIVYHASCNLWGEILSTQYRPL